MATCAAHGKTIVDPVQYFELEWGEVLGEENRNHWALRWGRDPSEATAEDLWQHYVHNGGADDFGQRYDVS